jgi:folate-binding protein YgfZ
MMAPRVTIDRTRLERLHRGAVLVRTEPAAFAVTGMGALQCLQGLLTNDLVQPGEYSLVYGALLTPKGMIVVDFWVVRRPEGFLMLAVPEARHAAVELLRRQLPPRLARMEDLTGQIGALWLHGENALGTLRFARIGSIPESEGRVTEGGAPESSLLIGRPHGGAPFEAVITGAPAVLDPGTAALIRAGASLGDENDATAARILHGWPALGAEIGERTLPQEVRYDEINGVSYTKGCYTGQETVARLHFRGHTNRELRGVVAPEPWPEEGNIVLTEDGKEVGQLGSTLLLPGNTVALAMVRREVEPGTLVSIGGLPATVVGLPFDVELLLG